MSAASGEAVLRPAEPSDADSIAALQIRSFRATYVGIIRAKDLNGLDVDAQAEVWATRISEASKGNRGIVVAAFGDRTAAYIQYGPAPDPDTPAERFGHVFSIHTDPAEASAGLGSVLMAHAEEAMRADGFMEATLWVVASNTGARRFYERLGWRVNGSTRTEALGRVDEPGENIEVETVRYRLPLGQ